MHGDSSWRPSESRPRAFARSARTTPDGVFSGPVGLRRAENPTVAELFATAQKYGVCGDFAGKKRTFERVYIHPLLDEDSATRVEVFRADIIRRAGDPVQALTLLDKVRRPDAGLARVEYHMARCWAHYGAARGTDRADLRAAMAEARLTFHAGQDAHAALPPDKRAYAAECFLGCSLEVEAPRYTVVSAAVRVIRQEIPRIRHPRVRARQQCELRLLLARYFMVQRNYCAAMSAYLSALQSATGDYYRISAALGILESCSLGRLLSDRRVRAYCDRAVDIVRTRWASQQQVRIECSELVFELRRMFPGLSTLPFGAPVSA